MEAKAIGKLNLNEYDFVIFKHKQKQNLILFAPANSKMTLLDLHVISQMLDCDVEFSKIDKCGFWISLIPKSIVR